MRVNGFGLPVRGLLLLPALLGGCVTAGRYDELQRNYDRARAELKDSHTHNRALQQQVDAQTQLAEKLGAAIANARAQLARFEAEAEENARLIAAQEAEGVRLTGELADLIKDRSRLKQSTDELTQALAGLNLRKAEAERRVAEFRSMLARFQNLIDAGTLRVRIVDGRMVLALPTDVLFDSGSARLSKVGKEAVQQVGSVLAGMNSRRFQIEGHTDDVPIRTAQFPSNWELAAARALVVVRAMMASGMASETLSAASYGEFRPAQSNDSVEGRAENRRIEVVLLPDLSSLPGFEELQRAVSVN